MTQQPSLPLEAQQPLPLREAYARTDSINTRYTYEQAMAQTALALALRLHAEAIARQEWK